MIIRGKQIANFINSQLNSVCCKNIGYYFTFVLERMKTDLNILINDERLKEDETGKFVNNAFCDRCMRTIGVDVDNILSPMSSHHNSRRATK
jgi:type I restriction enzyme R subunit